MVKIIGSKPKIITRLLKGDWKTIGMAKKMITDLIGRIQPIVTALKKNFESRSRTLLNIKKYWGQAFYDWFYNIDKVLGFDKFFCCLRIIVK